MKLTNENQKDAIYYYSKFMESMGIDLSDTNSADTAKRVVKMYRDDLFKGLYSPSPNITVFDNLQKYDGMVFQGNIELKSVCSHHHCPFIGKAHIAYIPSKDGKIIGLSKLNRVVDWLASKPQVQENLTMEVHSYLDALLTDNDGIAITMEANHTCVSIRGIKNNSTMKTCKLSGSFYTDEKARSEYYNFINQLNN